MEFMPCNHSEKPLAEERVLILFSCILQPAWYLKASELPNHAGLWHNGKTEALSM